MMKQLYALLLKMDFLYSLKIPINNRLIKIGFNLPVTLLMIGVFLGGLTKANSQTITLKSSNTLIIDSNKACAVPSEGPLATYVAYQFCNNTASPTTALDATFSISGTGYNLAGGQAASQSLGVLQPGECATLFWYISYPCTVQPGTINITLTDVDNQVISTQSDVLSTVKGPSANATGILNGVSLNSSGVGQVTSYEVIYSFGSTSAGGLISFQPAGNTDYDAGCFQLIGLEIVGSDIPDVAVGTTDEMVFYLDNAITGSGNLVTVRYYIKNKCIGANTIASPYAYGDSGTQLKYTGNFDDPTFFGSFPTTVNNLSITKTVSVNNITTVPAEVTYTIRIENGSSIPASIDKITDILPSQLSFNGLDISSDVTTSNASVLPSIGKMGELVFEGGTDSNVYPYTEFLIPANGTLNLVYKVAIPAGIAEGSYTNSATFTAGDYTSSPAQATFYYGPIPPVANDDFAVTEQDIPISFNVTTNDTDSDGVIVVSTVDLDPSTIGQQTFFAVSGEGSYVVDSNGNVVFTPESGFTGTSIIYYTIKDNDGATSNLAEIKVQIGNVCTEDVEGENFLLSDGQSVTFDQPGTNYGFQFDIYTLDNSFNLNINGVNIATQELEFQSAETSGINVRFQDGDQYEANTSGKIWEMTGTNAAPLIRVVISPSGVVSMYGSKTSGGALFPLELFNGNSFNTRCCR